MRLLLDTHVLLWWDRGDPLAASAVRAIQEADEVMVSAATAWELSIKIALGKVRRVRDVQAMVMDYGFRELPVTFSHTNRLRALPPHHRDPFDRMLVAQALEEELRIVSRDHQLHDYGVPIISV